MDMPAVCPYITRIFNCHNPDVSRAYLHLSESDQTWCPFVADNLRFWSRPRVRPTSICQVVCTLSTRRLICHPRRSIINAGRPPL